MDSTEAIKNAQQFAATVAKTFDCKEIFLFGSYASGTHHEESDIDIAVVLQEFENQMTMRLELMRIRRKIDSRIEPHPFRARDFNPSNPMANEILKHGKRLNSNPL